MRGGVMRSQIGGSVIEPIPWADLNAIAPAAYPGQIFHVTDVGPAAGSLFISDGTYWVPLNGSVVLKQWAVPVGIAPSGTISNNGAVTLGTALNTTYSSGVWLYFPANAIFAGSAAGIYWCKMSSTTVGTVYNSTLAPLTEVPYVPATDVPFVTTGPGAYTGHLTTETVATITVPGGLLGPNGGLFVQDARVSTNNSASQKLVDFLLGGSSVSNKAIGSITLTNLFKSVQNAGSEARQIGHRANTLGGGHEASSSDYNRTTVDTTVDQPFRITLDLATSTDFIILEAASLVVRTG